MIDLYPKTASARDRWILARRPARAPLNPLKPFAFFPEKERAESGEIAELATIFLTNRECPWRCVMCDLWKHTLVDTVPIGAIPAQIDYALSRLSGCAGESAADVPSASSRFSDDVSRGLTSAATSVRQIKLYNSGSFFDPRAIPVEDDAAIAERVRRFDRVIVECHPALVGDRCLRFRERLDAGREPMGARRTTLEVAMGLETVHPDVLEKLNKRMTLADFRQAAGFLRANDIALRVFLLARPPFMDGPTAQEWAKRSIDFAFDCGSTVVSVIPTRPGNGALEELAERGEFSPPGLEALEAAVEYGIGLKRGRVFADLWDLEQFSQCPFCLEERRVRLNEMNLKQIAGPAMHCDRCADPGLRPGRPGPA